MALGNKKTKQKTRRKTSQGTVTMERDSRYQAKMKPHEYVSQLWKVVSVILVAGLFCGLCGLAPVYMYNKKDKEVQITESQVNNQKIRTEIGSLYRRIAKVEDELRGVKKSLQGKKTSKTDVLEKLQVVEDELTWTRKPISRIENIVKK